MSSNIKAIIATKEKENEIEAYNNHLHTTKAYEQIMNKLTESYNVSKKKDSEENMKEKKEACQYKIVREYKSLFSCNELIERIIRYHSKENKELTAKV